MYPPRRQLFGVRSAVHVVLAWPASPKQLPIWARVEDHYHWYDPPVHPRALEAPHRRRDEQQHCYCPPLQPMRWLLRLRLLLVLLQGRSRLEAELAGRWSGEDYLE